MLFTSTVDLVSEDEYLDIPSISRQRAGTYECTAVNDIATDVQTVEITVNCEFNVNPVLACILLGTKRKQMGQIGEGLAVDLVQ